MNQIGELSDYALTSGIRKLLFFFNRKMYSTFSNVFEGFKYLLNPTLLE